MSEAGSLQERTIVVRNIDGNRQWCKELLTELFSTFGPLVNIVLRPDFAFVEYTHREAVGFALAMLDGVTFHGRPLSLRPKIEDDSFYVYQQRLNHFTTTLGENSSYWDQYLKPEEIKERDVLRRKLELKSKSSDREQEKLEKRYFQYAKHCELRSTYNPHLGIRFGASNGRGGGRDDRHYNRHSYEPYRRGHYPEPRYSNVDRSSANRQQYACPYSQPQAQSYHNGHSNYYDSHAHYHQQPQQQPPQHHYQHRHSSEQHGHHHHQEYNARRYNEEYGRRQGHDYYHRQHQSSRYQRPY